MMTLRETHLVPDFRSSQGRRHSLGAILALELIRHRTAQLLGFSPPCVATLHRVFKRGGL